jgi:spore maturation protein CgeB
MKILILNRDYPRFLIDMYASRPELCAATYAAQLAARNATLFGVADFYSHGFVSAGQPACEIHVNNVWLQSAWARENGLKALGNVAPVVSPGRGASASLLSLAIGSARRRFLPIARQFLPRQLQKDEERILAAQIESMRPDVILNQEMSYIRTARLARMVPRTTKIVGQIASALPIGEDYGRYDLVVSSLPNMVEHFRRRGVRAALSALAFDSRVLEQIEFPTTRDIPVSFVGSLSADHRARLRLLEMLAERVPLKVWGNGVAELPRSSPIRACFHGEAWGAGMYRVLARSRITINHHIDLAEGYCNNMRLYEATGCAALMVVDRGRNLADMFVPEKEVVTYSSIGECVEAVEKTLSNDAARAEIAAAGQRRTLSEHSYTRRTSAMLDLFSSL